MRTHRLEPFAVVLALLASVPSCALDLDALRKQDTTHGQAVDEVSNKDNDAAAPHAAITWQGAPDTGWYPGNGVADAPASHGASCGEIGQSCCMPGNSCESGACLRGHCTSFGGLYAEEHGCGAEKCSVRDVYTAGCACPLGFEAHSLVHAAQSCGDAGAGELELFACSASGGETTAFGGGWLARSAARSSCEDECITENATGKRCACPAGAGALRVELAAEDGKCAGENAALSLCLDEKATALGFGGGFVTTDETKPRCLVSNPLTGDCTCPGTVSAQLFTLGATRLGVCNL